MEMHSIMCSLLISACFQVIQASAWNQFSDLGDSGNENCMI